MLAVLHLLITRYFNGQVGSRLARSAVIEATEQAQQLALVGV